MLFLGYLGWVCLLGVTAVLCIAVWERVSRV
jgi:hypothetical protein